MPVLWIYHLHRHHRILSGLWTWLQALASYRRRSSTVKMGRMTTRSRVRKLAVAQLTLSTVCVAAMRLSHGM